MDFDVAEKAAKENERLQKARRDFEQLKTDEEKYLAELEEKASSRLSGIQAKIDDSSSLLEKITEKVSGALRSYQQKFSSFGKKLDFVLGRSDGIIESAVSLKSKAEKLLVFIEGKYKELQAFEEKLGTWDREIAKREAKADKLNKEADEKLAEALQLADWVRKGERYTIKRK